MLCRRVGQLLGGQRRALCTAAESSLAALKGGMSRDWSANSKRCGALGMKCGMTHAWSSYGEWLPLTVVELQDVQVVQRKEAEKHGFFALKVGSGWQKRKRVNAAFAGQFYSNGLPLKRYMREFRVTEDAMLPVGTSITARHFAAGQYVDVQGVTKGKGFQGVMKRWGFKGQPRSHGVSKAHRSRGSSGGAAGSMFGTRVRKGTKMAGRMGNKRRTAFSLLVYKVDPEHNLLYLKGSVPGHKGSTLRIKDAFKLSRRKRAEMSRGPFPTFLVGDEGDDDVTPTVAPPTSYDPIATGRHT